MLDSSTPSPSIPSRSLYSKQKDVLPGNWHYPTTLYISLFQFTFILFGAIHANIFRTNQRMCAVFIYGIAHSGLHTGSAAPANSMYSGVRNRLLTYSSYTIRNRFVLCCNHYGQISRLNRAPRWNPLDNFPFALWSKWRAPYKMNASVNFIIYALRICVI